MLGQTTRVQGGKGRMSAWLKNYPTKVCKTDIVINMVLVVLRSSIYIVNDILVLHEDIKRRSGIIFVKCNEIKIALC